MNNSTQDCNKGNYFRRGYQPGNGGNHNPKIYPIGEGHVPGRPSASAPTTTPKTGSGQQPDRK